MYDFVVHVYRYQRGQVSVHIANLCKWDTDKGDKVEGFDTTFQWEPASHLNNVESYYSLLDFFPL